MVVMPHLSNYGAQVNRKCTRSELDGNGSGPEVNRSGPNRVHSFNCPGRILKILEVSGIRGLYKHR